MSFKEKYEKYKLKYLDLKAQIELLKSENIEDQIGGSFGKLAFIDNYVKIRKDTKLLDSLAMILTSNRFKKISDMSIKFGKRTGFNTFGLLNNTYGYYYISRCYSERVFNEQNFKGTLIKSFQINKNNKKGVIKRLTQIYNDLIESDNKYYYYDIGFNDHTFLLIKYNNNYRILQSWMLKYQLENNIFNYDTFCSIPKFMVLLFAYNYHRCTYERKSTLNRQETFDIQHMNDLIDIIKGVFRCNNLQAKQYLNEFRILYQYYFSKELHIIPGTVIFDLDIEEKSENYLCPSFDLNIRLNKYDFNPDNILKNYNQTVRAAKAQLRTIQHRQIARYYKSKMGISIPYYNLRNIVNLSDSIKKLIINSGYSYLSRDHHYDSIMLNYSLKNYTIVNDSDNILQKLITLASLKYSRDISLVQFKNSRIRNKNKMIDHIYDFNRINQIAGGGTDLIGSLPIKISSPIVKHISTQQQMVEIVRKLDELQKIEKMKEYHRLIQIIMDNIVNTNDLITKQLLAPEFSSLDLTSYVRPEELPYFKTHYETIKSKTIESISLDISKLFSLYLSKLNLNQQMFVVIKMFLENKSLESLTTSIINSRKIDFFKFIRRVTQTEIIAGFGKLSLKNQIESVSWFNLINFITENKAKITESFSAINFKGSDELGQIEQIYEDICQMIKNEIPVNVIIKYIFPIISKNTEQTKTIILLSLALYGGTNCKNYINGLLDNEIFIFGKTDNLDI